VKKGPAHLPSRPHARACAAATLLVAALPVAGCLSTPHPTPATSTSTDDTKADTGINPDLIAARNTNLNRHVSPDFPNHPIVLPDRDLTGVDASQHFFTTSETLVVTSNDPASQLRAASIAVISHAPMLTLTTTNRAAILNEIARLKTHTILIVGDIPHLPAQPGIDYITDPETPDALGKLTALQFVTRAVTNPRHIPHAIADLDGDTAVELVPAWANTTTSTTSTTAETSTSTAAAPTTRPTQAPTGLKAFPAQSRRDADTAPIVIATAASTIAGIATAKAFGATIRILDDPDPRYSLTTMKQVAGLADQPLIALGAQFGTASILADRIRRGERTHQYQPGQYRRGTVYPHRIIVAHPINLTTARPDNPVDIDGEFEHLHERVMRYITPDPETQVTPALILTVDGLRPEQLQLWLTEATRNNTYLILHGDFHHLTTFETILTNPNVGMAPTGDHTQAATWLATLTHDHNLPQKLLLTLDVTTAEKAQNTATHHDDLAPVALIAAETPDDYHKIATQLPSGVTSGISISAHNPLNAWDMTQLTPRPLMINRG
jgi:hypothetical protein